MYKRQALASECEKLSIYVGDHAEITSEAVRAIVTQGKLAKAFALGDAVGERNLPKVLRRLDEDLWAAKTDRKKSVIGLVAGLVSKVRSLLFARELRGAGWVGAAGVAGACSRDDANRARGAQGAARGLPRHHRREREPKRAIA